MKYNIGDLVKFQSGYIGIILEIPRDFQTRVVIWILDDVKFKNPTHMSLDMLGRTSEVISESR